MSPREEFLFLDANASAPTLKVARDAMVAALCVGANPSSPHAAGRRARRVLDEARDQVASALGCGAKDLFFTSGASEGNRWLADALANYRERLGRAPRVVSSPFEHPSMARPLAHHAAAGAIDLKLIGTDAFGELDFSDVPGADVVVCTLAHNETGLLPNFDSLLESLEEETILIADAAQWVGRMGIVPARVDAAVTSAHKMGGVPGAGAVVWRGRARRFRPPWSGGGQEGGLRPGTEALPALAAFGGAASVIERTRSRHQALAPLRDRVEAALFDIVDNLVTVPLSNPNSTRLPNTTALCARGADGEALRMLLDRAGVCVGFGAACSALAPEPSPALLALGLSAQDARATMRLSLAPKDPDDDDSSAPDAPQMLEAAQTIAGTVRRALR